MSDRRNLFVSFRGRLMLLMTGFLLLTVVLVLVLERWSQKRVSTEVQSQNERVKEIVNVSLGSFAESLSMALKNLSSKQYLYDEIALDELPPEIKHIIVAEEDGNIADSTDKALVSTHILVPRTPVAQNRLGDPVGDESEFPGAQINTYYLPITTAKGLYWIVIVEQRQAVIGQIQDSSQELADDTRNLSRVHIAATTGSLSVALVIAVIIGWRFTQPIGELAGAARKVAAGQLDFQVPTTRRDELGQLSSTFNEMISGLKAKREIEEKLHQTERAALIGRMAQAVAHDIRNPLNVLKLSLGHVAAKFKPEEANAVNQFGSLVTNMKDEIGRLESLVNDLLVYARPGSVKLEVLDLRELLKDSISSISAQAEEQGIEVSYEQNGMRTKVRGDSRGLKSCISNIVVNAVQAMPGGGRLTAIT